MKFTDAKGREWDIPHFDPLNIDEVQQQLGVSLYTLTNGNMENLRDLFNNVPVFFNVVYVLVKDQAKERGVDDRSFAQGMVGGDVLEAAQEAFWQEVLFFSPKRLREMLTKLKSETDELIAETNPKLNQKLTAGLRKLFGDLLDSPDLPPKE